MPPTFLWVLKFDVKLGVGNDHFRNYHIHMSFQIWGSKSRFFFDGYQWQIEMCERFLENFKTWFAMQNGKRWNPAREPAKRLIFDPAPTMSLRGPGLTIYQRGRRPSLRMDGWDGWMGWTEYQKCPLKIFIICWYIDKVYIYLHM